MHPLAWLSRARTLIQLPATVRDLQQNMAQLHAKLDRLIWMGSELQQRTDGVHILMEQEHKRFATRIDEHTLMTTTIFEHIMLLDTRDRGFMPLILRDRIWESATTETWLRLIEPGMTVVEVGANFGYFTLIGAALAGSTGKYYAFEANPDTFAYLQKSIAINRFDKTTTSINMAVAERRGTVTLHKDQMYPSNSNILPPDDTFQMGFYASMFSDIEIEMTSLDEYFADRPGRIHVVKIDAEGSEPKILQGMERILTENQDIRIVMEYSQWWLAHYEDPLASLRRLAALGFRFWIISASDGVPNPGHEGDLLPIEIEDLRDIELCELVIARSLRQHERMRVDRKGSS